MKIFRSISAVWFLALLINFRFDIAFPEKRKNDGSKKFATTTSLTKDAIWWKNRLSYTEPKFINVNGSQVTIFIHAAVGVFKKKRVFNETACLLEERYGGRPCKLWGFRNEILKEMLITIRKSGLWENLSHIYVTSLGNPDDRTETRKIISEFGPKVSILIEGDNIYLAEFPTLHALQLHASQSPGASLFLYMHTVIFHSVDD